jgi:hypothetical protein
MDYGKKRNKAFLQAEFNKKKKQDWTAGKKKRASLQAEIEVLTEDAERQVLYFSE